MDSWLRGLGQSDLKCHANRFLFLPWVVPSAEGQKMEMLTKKFRVCVQQSRSMVWCLEAASGLKYVKSKLILNELPRFSMPGSQTCPSYARQIAISFHHLVAMSKSSEEMPGRTQNIEFLKLVSSWARRMWALSECQSADGSCYKDSLSFDFCGVRNSFAMFCNVLQL